VNAGDSGYARLEGQIDWFDRRSSAHQVAYRRLKIVSIGAAALVPLVSSFDGYAMYAGLLGVVVVIAEGWQQISQHHENWIRYRATCEHLRHEKYLFLAAAGPYQSSDEALRRRLLADRVETVLARESLDWERTRLSVDEPSVRRHSADEAASSQGR
jgi:hypothetical protein